MRVLAFLIGVVILSPLTAAARPLSAYDPAHARAPAHAPNPSDTDADPNAGSESGSGNTGIAVVLLLGMGVLVFAGLRSRMIVSSEGRLATDADDIGPTRTPLPPEDPWEAELGEVLPGIAAGWVARLRTDDPALQIEALLDKAKAVYLRTQKAWVQRDLSSVRALMSDATYQRFGTQLGLLQQEGLREAQADVGVRGVQLVGYVRSEWFDTVQIALDVQVRRLHVPADLPDDEALRQAEARFATQEVEIWSFVRKAGARTAAERDLLGGKCPNCGAPFLGGQTNQCDHCQAIVNSGNYDWTLSEITRGRDRAEALLMTEIHGLREVQAVDPALNLQILEDRASLVFWKWIEARACDEPRRLAKLALPEVQRAILPFAGARERFRELRVTGVDTQSFELTAHQQRATVEIRWQGQTGLSDGGESALRGTCCRTRFTLARGRHAKTRTDNGMSTSRCPGCNAPLTDSLSAQCDHCRTALNASPDAWVLVGEETVDLNG